MHKALRTMRITGPAINALAVWKDRSHGTGEPPAWWCCAAGKKVSWMMGRDSGYCIAEFEARGLKYEWVESTSPIESVPEPA